MNKLLSSASLVFALSACVDDKMRIAGCESVGDIRPVCGMQAPEDIAALADDRHLLLAHFGGMAGGRGSLSLFDTQTDKLTPLFPPADGDFDTSDASWGAKSCSAPNPASFSPHGTHLHQMADGRWRYLTVNHGGRESVQMFEVLGEGAGTTLAWRGCIEPVADTFMNDVVGLDNGDVIYTRMFHHNSTWEQLTSLVGADTGDLWRWNQSSGLRVLPGTEANQPNGIEISADNRFVFANMYFTGELWKVNAGTGEVVATAPIASADNSAWGTDGRLWLVTHQESAANILSCFDDSSKPCGARFVIIAVDPETLEFEPVFEHRGAPMGAATIAVPQAGRVYIGSFAGDRLISVPDFSLIENTGGK